MVPLVEHPKEAVPWLRKRLGMPLDRQRVLTLLKALDSRKFRERDSAVRDLKQLGPVILAPVTAALEDNPSADKRQRLEEVRKHLMRTVTSHDMLAVRLIDVLEHIPTQ